MAIGIANAFGLDGLSNAEMNGLVAAMAAKVERDLKLTPPINPDRRYRIKELASLGYGRGRFYKAHKHLIRKDGRTSYVLGRDLLALQEAAPRLGAGQPVSAMRRSRGRPRKATADGQQPSSPAA